MKTKDLIKMLQEADPKGEGHIRMSGGIPKYAIAKEGYWDGSYLDDNNNWVYSAAGYKVDLYTYDIFDFVDDMMDTYNEVSWEDVKSKFRFELNCYSNESSRDERSKSILKEAKEAYDEISDANRSFRNNYNLESVKRATRGWLWYQDMDNQNMWLIYDENGKLQDLYPANFLAVLKSGLFEKKESELVHGYYEWTLINKNNQNEK